MRHRDIVAHVVDGRTTVRAIADQAGWTAGTYVRSAIRAGVVTYTPGGYLKVVTGAVR